MKTENVQIMTISDKFTEMESLVKTSGYTAVKISLKSACELLKEEGVELSCIETLPTETALVFADMVRANRKGAEIERALAIRCGYIRKHELWKQFKLPDGSFPERESEFWKTYFPNSAEGAIYRFCQAGEVFYLPQAQGEFSELPALDSLSTISPSTIKGILPALKAGMKQELNDALVKEGTAGITARKLESIGKEVKPVTRKPRTPTGTDTVKPVQTPRVSEGDSISKVRAEWKSIRTVKFGKGGAYVGVSNADELKRLRDFVTNIDGETARFVLSEIANDLANAMKAAEAKAAKEA